MFSSSRCSTYCRVSWFDLCRHSDQRFHIYSRRMSWFYTEQKACNNSLLACLIPSGSPLPDLWKCVWYNLPVTLGCAAGSYQLSRSLSRDHTSSSLARLEESLRRLPTRDSKKNMLQIVLLRSSHNRTTWTRRLVGVLLLWWPLIGPLRWVSNKPLPGILILYLGGSVSSVQHTNTLYVRLTNAQTL